MAPLTPVWTKQDVVKKLESGKSGLDCTTLFQNASDNKSELKVSDNKSKLKVSDNKSKLKVSDAQQNDCIIKELIQNECNFDRFTGEFQCIPFKRLFKECKIYNPRKVNSKKVQSNSSEPNPLQKSMQAEPDYRIQRIEITNIDTNDDTYTCEKFPTSKKPAAQNKVLENLDKYHELGKP